MLYSYRGMIHCFRVMVRTEGWRSLFTGMPATLLRAFPLNAVTFSVYEFSLRLLNAQAQKSRESEF